MQDRTAYTTTKSTQPTTSAWRSTSDKHLHSYQRWGGAASLHPDLKLCEEYAEGNPQAIEIVRAWRPCNMWQGLIRYEQLEVAA